VEGLIPKFDGDVILCARDAEKGKEAVQSLAKDGLECKWFKLSIVNEDDVKALKAHLLETYGGLDILINNAAMTFLPGSSERYEVQAKETIRTNYYGTKTVSQYLFPILRPGARVVNLSSRAGFLGQVNGEEKAAQQLREAFAKSGNSLSFNELDEMMERFTKDCESNDDEYLHSQGWPDGRPHPVKGFPSFTYRISKVGVSALTRIQQQQFDKDPREDIVVNHVHPGYVNTPMTDNKGVLTPKEGSISPLYAALLPPKTPVRGQYIWTDCTVIDWVNGPTP